MRLEPEAQLDQYVIPLQPIFDLKFMEPIDRQTDLRTENRRDPKDGWADSCR